MKLLLYCTKGDKNTCLEYADNPNKNEEGKWCITSGYPYANGKIIAECEFEVEEARPFFHWCRQLETATCLTYEEVLDYLDSKNKSVGNPKRQGIAYLIWIHNLHIFNEPKELNDYYCIHNVGGMLLTDKLHKAPQNMQKISLQEWDYGAYNENDIAILISIRPEWLYKILNGEKTIEIRKKVLKEMLKDD